MEKEKKGTPFLLGATIQEDGVNFAVVTEENDVSLLLYPKEGGEEAERIKFPSANRQGNIAYMYVGGLETDKYEYNFMCGDTLVVDPYAKRISGKGRWGQTQTEGLRAAFHTASFDWQGDKPLRIPYEDSILYRMHVRGFTKHSSSNVKNRGTYRGIIEKIPYMKELGITMIELMPVHEFDEVMIPDFPIYVHEIKNSEKTSSMVNYWGYTGGFYFAPKTAYAASADACTEFKELVRELHKNGIEIGVEFYFVSGTKSYLILDCLKYWVSEYHLDAIHINSDVAPMQLIAQEPFLTEIKLFANNWNADTQPFTRKERFRNLGEFNDGFLVDIRRFLKGDENQVNAFLSRMTRNPEKMGVVNYVANHDSLTLADMTAYEKKHNEANGEGNRDGNYYNYSWNCGAEGASRRKKVLERREQQVRNALTLLFLGQGTPMLFAGDELGRTTGGNNNPYCQDNEISWVNWRLSAKKEELLRFVKELIAFRKNHRIFHMPEPLKLMDYAGAGCPDLSYHGVKPWYPEMDAYSRHIALMYCGAYAKLHGFEEDSSFYLACNVHWEEHEFALPNAPRGKKWYAVLNTGNVVKPSLPVSERELENQKKIKVSSRTIIVLIAK